MLRPEIPKVVCGSDCRECGQYSYDGAKPSYLYLLTHPDNRLHRVGIGTIGKDKGYLEKLINDGWLVHGLWHDSDKRRTFSWEKEIFRQLEARYPSEQFDESILVGRRDKSWVEGINADLISLSALEALVKKIVAELSE